MGDFRKSIWPFGFCISVLQPPCGLICGSAVCVCLANKAKTQRSFRSFTGGR
uniref:Uncharacterized protein n=1 Tax=Anguilla anguilla TaxID=7936 RepID=A0A0E9QR03_ANGAN